MKNLLELRPWGFFVRFASVFFLFFVLSGNSLAGEYPVVSDGTVIGGNYGYAQGTPEATEAGGIDLVVEAAFFSKNLEIPDGRTYIGYLAPIRLRYRPNERLTLEAGALLGRNYGDDRELDVTEPLLRLAYEPIDAAYLIAGSLIRTHPIHDALFDDAWAFGRNAEHGLQIRVDGRRLKEDLWLNWKVRETERRSEKFDFASVTQLRFGGLWLDGQLFWVHTGGQLNNPDDPLLHVVDHNIGFLGGGSYGLGPLRVGGYYLYDKDIPDADSGQKKSTGSGIEGRVAYDAKPAEWLDLTLFGSHFAGDGLLCRLGDPLYGKDEYSQLGANLLFGPMAGLRVEFGIAVQYYDGSPEHTEQLHILWGKGFKVARAVK